MRLLRNLSQQPLFFWFYFYIKTSITGTFNQWGFCHSPLINNDLSLTAPHPIATPELAYPVRRNNRDVSKRFIPPKTSLLHIIFLRCEFYWRLHRNKLTSENSPK